LFKRFILQMKNRQQRFHCLRLAALAAALAAVFFIACGVSLWHSDAPGSDATCPICHAAHMPALQAAPVGVSAALALVRWLVPAEARSGHSESFSLIPPARAPPA
jgi:hypothetical protein